MRIPGHTIILATGWLLLASCTTGKRPAAIMRHKNIIVLADLGKRLELYNQAGRDKAIFSAIFGAFEKNIRGHLYIHSKDKLHVIVAPNSNLQPSLADWQNRLLVDIDRVAIKDRVQYMKTCRATFFNRLDSLYTEALAPAERTSSDLWRFFNGQLNSYLQTDTLYDNYVIVLTNGYSEGAAATGYTGSAALLAAARQQPDWQQFAAGHRLKQVTFVTPRLHLFFAELQPDSAMEAFPDELKLVQEIWNNWARWCNPAGNNKTLPRITEANVQNEIAAFINAVAAPVGNMPPQAAARQARTEVATTVITQPANIKAPPAPPVKTSTPKPVAKPGGGEEGFSIRQDF